MEWRISRSALRGQSTRLYLSRGGELMLFLQDVHWIRTSLPQLATVVGYLREFLETLLAGTKYTKRLMWNRAIQKEHWTTERRVAWDVKKRCWIMR